MRQRRTRGLTKTCKRVERPLCLLYRSYYNIVLDLNAHLSLYIALKIGRINNQLSDPIFSLSSWQMFVLLQDVLHGSGPREKKSCFTRWNSAGLCKWRLKMHRTKHAIGTSCSWLHMRHIWDKPSQSYLWKMANFEHHACYSTISTWIRWQVSIHPSTKRSFCRLISNPIKNALDIPPPPSLIFSIDPACCLFSTN